jgi:beta-ribofuranosylaminobenzene 5'-phosphate synthase
MIRVRAASRLHFGLLHLASKERAPAAASRWHVPERLFGGVGLMIEDPGVQLTVARSATWAAQGPLADRAMQTAERVKVGLTAVMAAPHLVTVERAAPEHAGLGTGTQLALAVARGLTASAGLGLPAATELARLAGRGLRSALGVHGFDNGGFLVEGGKWQLDALSPLVARLDFPDTWRILVILLPVGPGLHGLDENRAFQQLRDHPVPGATTDLLCRLVLLGMLPALAEQDWSAFGQALYEFNVLVGETFASVQGGIYANPAIGDLVSWLRDQGIPGAGQSSWGPAVFAIARDEGQARSLVPRVRSRFSLPPDAVLVTRACNRGGTIEELQ